MKSRWEIGERNYMACRCPDLIQTVDVVVIWYALQSFMYQCTATLDPDFNNTNNFIK